MVTHSTKEKRQQKERQGVEQNMKEGDQQYRTMSKNRRVGNPLQLCIMSVQRN